LWSLWPPSPANGTTVTCDGLSQWGSQELATAGAGQHGHPAAVLRKRHRAGSGCPCPGPPKLLSRLAPARGAAGPDVVVVQTELNRIGQNYPAIPKIQPVDGVFGQQTEEAVRRFQEIFGLTADGVVARPPGIGWSPSMWGKPSVRAGQRGAADVRHSVSGPAGSVRGSPGIRC
jgi:hypothetical protein